MILIISSQSHQPYKPRFIGERTTNTLWSPHKICQELSSDAIDGGLSSSHGLAHIEQRTYDGGGDQGETRGDDGEAGAESYHHHHHYQALQQNQFGFVFKSRYLSDCVPSLTWIFVMFILVTQLPDWSRGSGVTPDIDITTVIRVSEVRLLQSNLTTNQTPRPSPDPPLVVCLNVKVWP